MHYKELKSFELINYKVSRSSDYRRGAEELDLGRCQLIIIHPNLPSYLKPQTNQQMAIMHSPNSEYYVSTAVRSSWAPNRKTSSSAEDSVSAKNPRKYVALLPV